MDTIQYNNDFLKLRKKQIHLIFSYNRIKNEYWEVFTNYSKLSVEDSKKLLDRIVSQGIPIYIPNNIEEI